ncbi:MAG: hypothetical protein VX253_11565 [Bacteroidota bacterium]|jgi:hypothetical protein|nr:hypothetical protein [Bacteroidota bacterium]
MKLKQLVSEAKFAVEVEDIGTVIVDGSSETDVKSRVAKKLKGGKEMIKGIRKITKDKAGKASKALGEELPLYSDYAKSHKEEAEIEAAFNQANRGSTGPDASGVGETEPGDHRRGTKKRGQKWLDPNPKNQW